MQQVAAECPGDDARAGLCVHLKDGNGIGSIATGVPNWSVGDAFVNKDHNVFRILDIVSDLGDGEFAGAFLVVPIELAELLWRPLRRI